MATPVQHAHTLTQLEIATKNKRLNSRENLAWDGDDENLAWEGEDVQTTTNKTTQSHRSNNRSFNKNAESDHVHTDHPKRGHSTSRVTLSDQASDDSRTSPTNQSAVPLDAVALNQLHDRQAHQEMPSHVPLDAVALKQLHDRQAHQEMPSHVPLDAVALKQLHDRQAHQKMPSHVPLDEVALKEKHEREEQQQEEEEPMDVDGSDGAVKAQDITHPASTNQPHSTAQSTEDKPRKPSSPRRAKHKISSPPILKARPTRKRKEGIKWDENALAATELEKQKLWDGGMAKIHEPKTPFSHWQSGNLEDPKHVIPALTLAAALGRPESAASSGYSTDEKMDWTSSGDEDQSEEAAAKRRHQLFLHKRADHYDMKKALESRSGDEGE